MPAIPLKRVVGLAAAALIATALVALTPTIAEAAGVPCQKTYFSGPVNAAIKDNDVLTPMNNVINVPEDGLVVSDIDVALNIHHAYDADLLVSLYSETDANGIRYGTTLISHQGGAADNFLGTVLDDEASEPITWGAAPFGGAFKPYYRLSALDGYLGGQYRIYVVDNSSGDTGTLDSWSVTLTYKSCDFDSDGVEDHADRCLGVTAHTASGCPKAARAITAKYASGKFRGAVVSPTTKCKAARAATIWRVRSGPDAKVGTATTRADGRYLLTRARKPGRYYATSPRVVITGVAECPAVKSATFRIR